MMEKINNVTSAAVRNATGKAWKECIRYIDQHGGAALDHKAITKLLKETGGIKSGWWQQMVTVGYEHAKGRRQTGETADAGFQVGVQLSIPMERSALWDLLTSDEGVNAWLGPAPQLIFESGTRFEIFQGPSGEIRTVEPGHRVRLTWKQKGREDATTVQLTLQCPRNNQEKTTLRFHHEKLANLTERELMRSHWRGVLRRLAKIAGQRADS